ncbi:MAG: anaerobic ribonucleoside-triphosphate reductase, partial [bacterium]|nr:anaerobic ribonucleoside-triphosphate reductase [bacterium]
RQSAEEAELKNSFKEKRISMKNAMQNLEQQRTKCEIYSRVVGYLRPVKQWNDGKQAEFAERKEYKVAASD